jgi:hypothetical protein
VGRQVIQPDDVAWHQRAPKTCFTSARNPSAAVAPLTVITALDPLLVQRAQLGDSA